MKIQDALAVLESNIIARLKLYGVGTPAESSVLPQAIFTSPDELRALAKVIEAAMSTVATDTEGCYGIIHVLRARLTESGTSRIPDSKAGDIYPIKSITPGAGPGYWCAHVTDAARDNQIWSLGEGDWTPVGGRE